MNPCTRTVNSLEIWSLSLVLSSLTNQLQKLYHDRLDEGKTELHKQVGPWCLVCCLQLPSWWPNLLKHQWELNFGVMELFGAFPFAKFCRDGSCLNDLDAWKPHSVPRCHLSVHVFYCTIESCVTVLLVHVVITSSTLISKPNSIIVDLGWIFLKNLQSETEIRMCWVCPTTSESESGPRNITKQHGQYKTPQRKSFLTIGCTLQN